MYTKVFVRDGARRVVMIGLVPQARSAERLQRTEHMEWLGKAVNRDPKGYRVKVKRPWQARFFA